MRDTGSRSATTLLTEAVHRVMSLVGTVIVLGMLLYVAANVLLRWLANEPLPATTEFVARWFLVAVVATGWVVAEHRKDQITVTLLSERFKGRTKTYLDVLSHTVSGIFALSIAWFGFGSAFDAMARGEFGIDSRLPVWATRFFIPAAAILFLMYVAIAIRDAFRTAARAE